ncbi:MAG: hypothetical protein EOO42_18370 [Flavobacteriales bacterium]|nr:MAG: hypothetical protein EOO42_18370 [Flavobacteriales bacterium]
MELNSANKGLLLPRMSVNNLLSPTPITPVPTPGPADGLLIYNTNESATAGTKRTLFHWDATANLPGGRWNQHLFFKETPKTAVIGLTGPNIGVLDNAVAGNRAFVNGTGANQLTVINSGHLPNLEVSKDVAGVRVKLGPGTYIYEISFLLSAPPASPSSNAYTMGSSTYYNMGYYTDVVYRALPTPSDRYGRIENSVISQINSEHRIEFSMSVELTANESYIYPTLGRRVGSTHNDLVNIITSGTFIKITKLK